MRQNPCETQDVSEPVIIEAKDGSACNLYEGGAPFALGDDMTKKPTSVREKAEACLEAVLVATLVDACSVSEITANVRARLGHGWTLVSALQWLTGKTAQDYFTQLPARSSISGVPVETVPLLLEIAKACCEQLGRARPTEEETLARLREMGLRFRASVQRTEAGSALN